MYGGVFPSFAKEGSARRTSQCHATLKFGATGVLVQPPIIGSGTNHPVCAGKGCFAHLIDGAATPPFPRRGVRLLLIGPVSSR
jgi:hypothetical protein